MVKKNILWMFLIVVSLIFSTAPAFAKHEGTPHGWSEGKKTGWHNEGMPPGQVKKHKKVKKVKKEKTEDGNKVETVEKKETVKS